MSAVEDGVEIVSALEAETVDYEEDLETILGRQGVRITPLTDEEMRPYLADAFYRRLSRRELRDLLWATQSSDTSPFAVLIVLAEGNLGSTGQMSQTFIARMDGDLADFCEKVAAVVTLRLREILDTDKPTPEPKMEKDGRDSQGSTDDDDEAASSTESDNRRVHLIYSDHPHCLWKPCLNVLESLVRLQGSRVVQHRFSGVWKRRVQLDQT